jgi:uncharacterized protein with FMN-binding domain
MKKALGIILSSALVFSLAGCGAKSENTASNASSTTQGASKYKDGTYDVKNKSEKPGFEEAIVTIKDGKIQNVDLKRLDNNSKELNYDEWNGQGGKPNLKQAKQDLSKAMIEKQSADVDATSGATVSSNGWKKAVSDALAKASK